VRADLPPPNLHEHKLQNNPAEECVLHPPVTTHCAAARNKNEGRRRTSPGVAEKSCRTIVVSSRGKISPPPY
jgi:hypothetical protein